MDTSPVWPGAPRGAWSGDENARPDAAPTAGSAGAVGERGDSAARRPSRPSTSAPRRVVRLRYPPSVARLWRMAEGRIVKAEDYRDWLAAAREATRRIGNNVACPILVVHFLFPLPARLAFPVRFEGFLHFLTEFRRVVIISAGAGRARATRWPAPWC